MAKNAATPAAVKEAAGSLSYITVDELDKLDDRREMDVPIPEWGENRGVRIRALSQKQRGEIRKRSMVKGRVDEEEFALHQIVESVTEPKLSPAAVGVLKEKSARAIDRITEAINEVNGLNEGALQMLAAMFQGES